MVSFFCKLGSSGGTPQVLNSSSDIFLFVKIMVTFKGQIMCNSKVGYTSL